MIVVKDSGGDVEAESKAIAKGLSAAGLQARNINSIQVEEENKELEAEEKKPAAVAAGDHADEEASGGGQTERALVEKKDQGWVEYLTAGKLKLNDGKAEEVKEQTKADKTEEHCHVVGCYKAGFSVC